MQKSINGIINNILWHIHKNQRSVVKNYKSVLAEVEALLKKRADLRTLLGFAEALPDLIKNGRSETLELTKEIAEAVRLGQKTSGNAVHDYLIVRHHEFNPEIWQRLSTLQERIRNSTGQLLLAIETFQNVIGGRQSEGVTEKFCLCELTGPELIVDIDQSICSLPTSRYISHTIHPFSEYRILEQPLSLKDLRILDLEQPLTEVLKPLYRPSETGNPESRGEPYLILEFAVGDAEISQWIQRQDRYRLFKPYTDLVARLKSGLVGEIQTVQP